MIIRLRKAQHDYLLKLGLSDEVHYALERDAQIADFKGHAALVRAPYIAWALVRDHLVRRAFTASGARDKGVPQVAMSSLRDIQTAINIRDRHPAWRRAAALGAQMEMIPAWETSGGLHPRPCTGLFIVLEPAVVEAGGGFRNRLTEWHAREPSPGDDWTCFEESHLAFWAEAVQALGWSPDVDGAGVDQ